jgi:hypothetical protein
MTLPQIESMFEQWRRTPPVAVMVAGYLGYKQPSRPAEGQSQQDALDELAAVLGFAG